MDNVALFLTKAQVTALLTIATERVGYWEERLQFFGDAALPAQVDETLAESGWPDATRVAYRTYLTTEMAADHIDKQQFEGVLQQLTRLLESGSVAATRTDMDVLLLLILHVAPSDNTLFAPLFRNTVDAFVDPASVQTVAWTLRDEQSGYINWKA